MSRTAINVTGDLVACAVVERWSEPVTQIPETAHESAPVQAP
jgi:Na+/H+-dicarboxylate symporter